MISEQVKAYQEREQKKDLIKVIQRLAKIRGVTASDELVKKRTYEEKNLSVSTTVHKQIEGEWHFVTVISGDREVFSAGAFKSPQTRSQQLEFSISTYRAGPWEGHIRRLARPKPKGKR